MAPRSPTNKIKDFLQALAKSGLASEELLAQWQARTDDASDPRIVARELVQSGVLTRWQAGQLLHGYSALSIGKYRLLDQLESGPWGRTYLAEHVPMGRRHVLRVMSKPWAAQPARVRQFLEAARRASVLDHPHLCHVYDVNQEGDRPYVVLEYLQGETLLKRVERNGPLPPAEAVAVALQIAAGLAHAHDHGVFHPGLDPSQVVCDASGIVKVTGLGDVRTAPEQSGSVQEGSVAATSDVATAVGITDARELPAGPASAEPVASSHAASAPTASRLPLFQSPQRRTGEPPSAADDLYALGSTLVFLLTGRLAITAQEAGRLLEERSGIRPELVALCQRMMASSPADRPPGLAAVLTELERLAGPLVAGVKEAAESASPVVALTDAAGPPAEVSPPADELRGLPVAKPLPQEDTLPVIVAGNKTSQAIADVPVVAIASAGKSASASKSGAKAAAKATEPAPIKGMDRSPTEQSAPVLSGGTARFSPRVLLIGGGVLATGLLVAIGLGFWLWSSPGGPTAAQVPAGSSKSAVVAAAASPETNPLSASESNPVLPEITSSEATPPSSPEASPTNFSNSVSDNIQSKDHSGSSEPSASLSERPTDPKEPPPAAPTTGVAKATPAPTEPSIDSSAPSSSPSESPATGTAAQTPSPSGTAKTDLEKNAGAASPSPAPKTAPKAAAKAPPKPRPFEGLPAAVELPPLPQAGSATETLAPAVLGPCRVDDQAILLITLAGGAAATRNPKQSFDLVPQPHNTRQWEILLTGEAPQKIATLAVEKGQLTFAWQPDAGTSAGIAPLLSNCALILQTGDAQHVMALRKPVLGEPLKIDLDKPGNLRWTIPDLPPVRQLHLTVTRIEGIADFRKEPAEGVVPGNPLMVWVGPKDKPYPLGLRLTSSANNRGVSISFQPQIKLQGHPEPRPYRRKDIPLLQQQAAAEVDAATKGLEQAKRDRPSTNPVKGAIEKELIEQRKLLFTEKLTNLTTVIEQLAYIAQFMEATQGEAKLHFRIFYLADEVPIDLLVTETRPPPPPGKK